VRGVYLDRHDRPAPASRGGRPVERFMDAIYLSKPVEELEPDKIRHVNRARRRLMQDGSVETTNLRVKRAMAAAVNEWAPDDILEWGCGDETMHPFLDTYRSYTAVDIDPDVVSRHRRDQKINCRTADNALDSLPPQSIDVIISVFVFHFQMPSAHLRKMAEVLRLDGCILANVYRRSEDSRKRLREAFEAQGLQVTPMPDPSNACTEHEFWVIARPTVPSERAYTALNTVTNHMRKSTRSTDR
jgi:Methyltransferase domain